MIRRALTSTLLTVMLVVAAYVVLGPPDLGAVAGFFAGGLPTIGQGEAVVELISWIVIGAVAAVCVGSAVVAFTRSGAVRRRAWRGALVFAAGLLLLAVAVVQRSSPTAVSVCCGDETAATQEAQSLGSP